MSEDACCADIPADSLSETEAEQLAIVVKALADPIRIRLLSVIAASPDSEMCACDLPAIFERSQPTMSHHLSLLTQAGLIVREQRGKWAWFSVDEARLSRLLVDLAAAGNVAARQPI